jgi:hypothetical protein
MIWAVQEQDLIAFEFAFPLWALVAAGVALYLLHGVVISRAAYRYLARNLNEHDSPEFFAFLSFLFWPLTVVGTVVFCLVRAILWCVLIGNQSNKG